MTMQTIWREGDRIRRTDGTGYHDRVTDDQIKTHVLNHLAGEGNGDPLFVSFAGVVLMLREFERAAAAVSSVSEGERTSE